MKPLKIHIPRPPAWFFEFCKHHPLIRRIYSWIMTMLITADLTLQEPIKANAYNNFNTFGMKPTARVASAIGISVRFVRLVVIGLALILDLRARTVRRKFRRFVSNIVATLYIGAIW